MENGFLYEYLKYTKDELQVGGNDSKVNRIKAIICNDTGSNIPEDMNTQKEVLKKLQKIIITSKDLKKKKIKQKIDEDTVLFDLTKEAGYKMHRYEAVLNRIQQYLIHYEAMLKNWDCSFAVVFENGEIWSVNYTRSLRKDRIDTHITRFNYLHSDANYLVVSSYSKQDDQSRGLIENLKDNPSAYGTAINVVSFEELLDQIMANIFRYKKKDGILYRVPAKSELSIINGLRGVEIEKIYGRCLANKKNYECYLAGSEPYKAEETAGTFLPTEFAYIMDKILSDKEIDKDSVERIETKYIGNLKIKPDVYIEIYLKDSSKIEAGINIKASGAESVSFHEKKAEDFIRVLQITDEDVKNALIRFQNVKAVKNLTPIEQKILTEFFSKEDNKQKLVRWVVTGEETDLYRAHYVLSHYYGNDGKNLGINIIPAEKYIGEIMNRGDSKTFNSGFSWTHKGVIQLKGPVM